MNLIDGVEVKTFHDALRMASWIKTNVPNELRQEQLMYEGCQYHRVNGIYQITVELSSEQRDELTRSS
jgi:hypothetical protein